MKDTKIEYTFNEGTYAGVLQGQIPTKVEALPPPSVQWVGHKMPFTLWTQALSFLCANAKNEACIYMFYSLASGFRLHVPKQYVSSASVDIEHDEPEMFDLLETHVLLGDIHSHPGFGASASSTDRDSERRSDGVYITLGNLDRSLASFHIRAVISEYAYDGCPYFNDFIEIPTIASMPGFPVELLLFQTLYFHTAHPKEWDAKVLSKLERDNAARGAKWGYHNSGYKNNLACPDGTEPTARKKKKKAKHVPSKKFENEVEELFAKV